MRIQPECRACLERLVDLAVGLATADPRRAGPARDRALAIVDREFHPEAIPACIANLFLRAVAEFTGNPDPFAAPKAAQTRLLRRLVAELEPPPDADLAGLLELAAAGNALDFFREAGQIAADIRRRLPLPPAEVAVLAARLSRPPGTLLYLADNAGEQFFDLPLVAALRRRGWQVFYVVKGGPIQNDLTRADLAASGLAAALEPVVDTGAATVGLVLAEAAPAFRRLYAGADLIVAKGMGHFETLSRLPDPRLFFLLQAKCPPVAAALGVPQGACALRVAGG